MFPTLKWGCSWPLIAVVASVVALATIVHMLMFPVLPLLDSFGVPQVKNSSALIDYSTGVGDPSPALGFDRRFPADLHGAVVYRGAPWKAEIGQWLASCGAVTKEVKVNEVLSGKDCRNNCSGQGVCNHELGQCRCFHGYAGEGCSERLHFNCNHPASPEQPYGRWVVSICSAHCDTTTAKCFCGEGTKYPNRPVAEACGFQPTTPTDPNGPTLVDWSKADLDNIFTTNSSKLGWCNVDPSDAYEQKVQHKEACDCKYDGQWGRFCEIPVQSFCINQCSGHGHCRGGFCECSNGWYGTDCSIPSVELSMKEWPKWLRPAQVDVPDDTDFSGYIANVSAAVKKKRPLIYVYDLPPEFTSQLLEGRHFRLHCVNRIYDERNATIWTDELYGAQMAIYESILASSQRTLNGEEADFFFIPVLDSCIITRADEAPHLSLEEHKGLRSSLTLEYYKKAYHHIVEQYPYWNRSSGRDHIWFFSWDEGACSAPKEIWPSMMLVHWGNTNTKHRHSTTAYMPDNWDRISSNRRGEHTCFDPDKDLVLPAWKRPNVNALMSKLWSRPLQKRNKLYYFNGNLGPAYTNGRPESTYSMGLRQKLADEFGSTPNKEGKLGKQHAEDVIVTPIRSENYVGDLASSIFCGVLPGDGWSGRMEDSILQGCIPVIIQDGIFVPYENVLNFDSFAVRIREEEIPNLINILRGIDETEIDLKLNNVQQIWQRFLYRDSILLEAKRQKTSFGRVEDWAIELLQLTNDDAFATFVQVLHYKLHNDPWRQSRVHREYGLPQECLAGAK